MDLLKIDVERAELEVLAGVEAAHWPLIRQVGAARGLHGIGRMDWLLGVRLVIGRHGSESTELSRLAMHFATLWYFEHPASGLSTAKDCKLTGHLSGHIKYHGR